jgi:Zn-dependent peptidase ImmA (M78 family)
MIVAHLNFALQWINEVAGEPVRTLAKFSAEAEGETIWPARGASAIGLEIYVDDLLSHLAEFWQPLILRQNYPLPLTLNRPSQLRPEAETAWGALPEEQVELQEDKVAAFEQAHNLALSFGGQFDLPCLWLFRQGQYFLIETDDLLIQSEVSIVVDALSRIGDAIAERLENTDEPRWSRLVRSWRQRDDADPDRLLMWSTGLPRESASRLSSIGLLRPVSSVREMADDDDELRIAARMTGALPIAEIERLLRHASQIPARSSPELDELSKKAVAILDSELRGQQPFAQGVALARFARDALGLSLHDRAELLPKFFYKNKIYVEFKDLSLANLDAIAIWGRSHGPGILLNTSSRWLGGALRQDMASKGRARVTIAHEMCHLLVDRGHALGVVDIRNGRIPLAVEQRAGAFAAAFMLPAEAAVEVWDRVAPDLSKQGISSVLNRLTRRFGVTTIIARWQLQHGMGDQISPDLIFLLDQIAPQR